MIKRRRKRKTRKRRNISTADQKEEFLAQTIKYIQMEEVLEEAKERAIPWRKNF